MRKQIGILLSLFFISVAINAQKKLFDAIDVQLNVHIGTTTIEKERWKELSRSPLNYSLDTFQTINSVAKCIIFPFIPSSVSVGLRASKTLFRNNDHKLVADRFELRGGLMIGSKTESSGWYMSGNNFTPPQPATFTYKEVRLNYQRSWLDINTGLVYKIPSFLWRNKVKYHIGPTIGATFEMRSRLQENIVGYRATQSGNGYVITEESNVTNPKQSKSVASAYIGIASATEIILGRSFSLLFEANYQGYIHSFSLNERMYKEGGYLSTSLRYKF